MMEQKCIKNMVIKLKYDDRVEINEVNLENEEDRQISYFWIPDLSGWLDSGAIN